MLFDVLAKALGDAPSPALPLPRERASEVRFAGNVLLAEDNEVNQLVAVALLEACGLQVDVAQTGAQAVAATRRSHYDLLLMDCQMPEMDGFAATVEIRRHDANRRKRMPIFALTAHAMDGDRERCLAAGMDDYLAKPFDRERLYQVLHRMLHAGNVVTSRWCAQRRAMPAIYCLPSGESAVTDSEPAPPKASQAGDGPA